jgi:ribosomal protein S18 acetylase RimI-like enzyme
MDDLRRSPTQLIEALDKYTGPGVAGVIRRGGVVYSLIRDQTVLSQLNIEIAKSIIDTPSDLMLKIGENNAFLSFFRTNEAERRKGWGMTLVRAVCSALHDEGRKNCVCHVQATNVSSCNTFESIGWKSVALLISTCRRRFLGIVPFGQQNRELSLKGEVPSVAKSF